jgi:hypothetical protein
MKKDGADNVTARRRIEQSPLTDAPDVPRGLSGRIEDEDAPWLLVDFGEPYGVVICSTDDLR